MKDEVKESLVDSINNYMGIKNSPVNTLATPKKQQTTIVKTNASVFEEHIPSHIYSKSNIPDAIENTITPIDNSFGVSDRRSYSDVDIYTLDKNKLLDAIEKFCSESSASKNKEFLNSVVQVCLNHI